MLSIGEFSQAVRLTVKTLRYYQELGILVPARIDPDTGYRYYNAESYERAEAILMLKELGFSLKEIRQILLECSSEEEFLRFAKDKIEEIRGRIARLSGIENRLALYRQQCAKQPSPAGEGVSELRLNLPHTAALAYTGNYGDYGRAIRTLYKKAGRYAAGSPYGFYYDMEYKETGASMEAVIELKKAVDVPGIEYRSIRELDVVKAVYRGLYGGQGRVYMQLFQYCREHGYEPVPPVMEHYVKGPGILFRGNPEGYVTECILPVKKQ